MVRNLLEAGGTPHLGTFDAAVFTVDHCSSECIGIHAAATGDRFEALQPIHQGIREHFGGVQKGIVAGATAVCCRPGQGDCRARCWRLEDNQQG